MDNEFGKKLKNMMRSNKVGRPAVAGKLGVTARTVSRYVTGETVPDTEQQEKILHLVKELIREQRIAEYERTKVKRSIPEMIEIAGKIVKESYSRAVCRLFAGLDPKKQDLLLDYLHVFYTIKPHEQEILSKFRYVPVDKQNLILDSLRDSFANRYEEAMKDPEACKVFSERMALFSALKNKWGAWITKGTISFDDCPKRYEETEQIAALKGKMQDHILTEYLSLHLIQYLEFDENDWQLLLLLSILSVDDQREHMIEKSQLYSGQKYVYLSEELKHYIKESNRTVGRRVRMLSDYLDEWAGWRFVWDTTDIYLREKMQYALDLYNWDEEEKSKRSRPLYEIAERVMVRSCALGEYTAFYKVKRKISPERIVEVYITIDGKGEMLRDKTDMFGITSL